MSEKWYVLPAGFAMGRDAPSSPDEDVGSLGMRFYVHPTSSSGWPDARALPRRMRGKMRR